MQLHAHVIIFFSGGGNSPAYFAWNLDKTVQRGGELGNCTFDYFSWAKVLLEAHENFVVESSVRYHEAFEYLLETSSATFASDASSQSEAVLVVRGDIVDMRDALRRSFQRSEWDTMKCTFQQFPHQVSVCRDDRYVARFGEKAKCDPYPGQAGCGFDGFTCCMSIAWLSVETILLLPTLPFKAL